MNWKRKKGGLTKTHAEYMARVKKIEVTKDRTTPKVYFRLTIRDPSGNWSRILYRGKDFATLLGAKNRADKILEVL